MGLLKWARAASAMNGLALALVLRKPSGLRGLLSSGWRQYREITGAGLAVRDPLEFLFDSHLVQFDAGARIQFPPVLHGGGGTRREELLYLAAAARMLQPRCVFEIGTFTGLTTALFILNAPESRVITLDLPPDAVPSEDYIATDLQLVQERKTGHFLRMLGLADRYEQIFCDSLEFNAEPLTNVVDLGFIDGSHALRYVVNDTEKMGRMISDRGLVFWHDYGGVGDFWDLTRYLESLGAKAHIYRAPDTSLAWAAGAELKAALAH
jgi:predicted O-methyltransferase YrrM